MPVFPQQLLSEKACKNMRFGQKFLGMNGLTKKTQKRNGHAIVVYMYPKGQNKLWTYDFWGSYRVRAFKDNPLQIAKEAVRVRYEDRDVYFAEFIK